MNEREQNTPEDHSHAAHGHADHDHGHASHDHGADTHGHAGADHGTDAHGHTGHGHDHAGHDPAAHGHSHDHADSGRPAPHGEEAWDERYRSKPEIWSGNPNDALVTEIASLKPGTALDAGAGEGGDAFWLARQGWTVTAADISSVAIGRAAKRAGELGLAISWLHADLAKVPAPQAYDLVTAHFLHVPRSDQQPLFRHLAEAVAPGGTLLVVGHAFSDMEKLPRPDLKEFGWTPDDVAAALPEGESWTIEASESRPRRATGPDGEEVTINDAILRARRN
jgi:SAM-dependent methyltransferase